MEKWNSFLADVENIIDKLNDNGCDMPFFRGHANSSWKLIPSLFRDDRYLRSEIVLYYDFVSYSSPLFDGNKSSWDYLFEMRHCGLPTRLLDWTENFAVALYFAVKDNPFSPCIWVLDPYKLNLQSWNEEGLLNPSTDLEFDYFSAYIEKIETKKSTPVALIPNKQSKRVFAQKGVFTLHSDNTSPLEELFNSCIHKVEIPLDIIEDAERFLYLAGINEYTLFPDFDGLSRYLIKRHFE